MTHYFDGSDPMLSWWIAIVVVIVVTAVVYMLLRIIIDTAGKIERTVSLIWVRGQRVANNTIHIANLYRTNDCVQQILASAARIAASASALEQHARSCPGCPACLVSQR
jgi:hypothetical protein